MTVGQSYAVQNRKATRPEWVLSQVWQRLKISYRFQVSILGGRSVRGGYVVDFVVQDPFDRPAEVFGRHWHNMGSRDRLKLAVLRNYFGREAAVFWEDELEDVAEGVRAARAKGFR